MTHQIRRTVAALLILPACAAVLCLAAPAARGADTAVPAVPAARSAQPFAESATALIARTVPAPQAALFRCEVIPAADGKDVYEIESCGGKIVLRGNSGVALASAFYHYLKEFCHCHVSWNGDQLSLPAVLPAVPQKIRVVAPVEVKFAYNYCTHGYTMAFWGWSEWERELDWLALHGINMALIIEGQEAVWQNTFARFGYTKEEVRNWICSPVHQPWQYMQNMEGVLPPSQAIIDKRVALGQKIVRRCRELGIRPVLQGFYGMIPFKFKEKFPDAKIVAQGGWAGNNHRPDMLHIADPRFVPIATAFLEEQRKLFGECHHFAADPFHEGGQPGDMNRGAVYKVIQDAIFTFDPKATAVKQCWQTSNKEMFDAGDKSRSLALDLWCDHSPFWSRCNGYDGTPWVWCLLHNFGGNIGMEGNLPRMAKDFGGALVDPNRGKLSGIALVPEGSNQNPVVYELMTEMGWRGAPADIRAWVGDYILARYGRADAHAGKAWELMLQTNYSLTSREAPFSSVITAAPRLDPNIRGRAFCSGSRVPYDNRTLAEAWGELLAAAPGLGRADTFRYDLADVTRQVLCNLARPIYDRMAAAYQKRDAAAFALHSKRLLGLIRDLDPLLATRRDWLMGRWIRNARAGGDTAEDKKYLEQCARLLLTTWMPDPNTNLTDYASREWQGLTGEYYFRRWELFVTALADDLAGKQTFNQGAANKARTAFEVSWINGQSKLPDQPVGDTIAISKALRAKYLSLFDELYGAPPVKPAREWVVGCWEYAAEGSTHLREFRADGTIQAYRKDGVKINWFDGFRWRIDGLKIIAERQADGKVVTFTMPDKDTLEFASEGFGNAKRVPTPAP